MSTGVLMFFEQNSSIGKSKCNELTFVSYILRKYSRHSSANIALFDPLIFSFGVSLLKIDSC